MLGVYKKVSTVVVVWVAASLGLVSGCGQQSQEKGGATSVNVSMLSGFTVDKERVARYAEKNKLEPASERYARAMKSYVERNGLAYVIANESTQVMSGVMSEVIDKRNNLLIKEYLDAYVDDAVGDAAVKDYYTAHPEIYTKKKAKLAHVLIAAADGAPDVLAKKREEAVALVESVRKGDDFSVVASKHSDDKETRNTGGEIGWVAADDERYGILLEAALSARGGEVLEPIQTRQGFHVVKLLEDVAVEEVPFESVKDKIAYQLKYEARTKEMARLKDLASVKIKEDIAALGIE